MGILGYFYLPLRRGSQFSARSGRFPSPAQECSGLGEDPQPLLKDLLHGKNMEKSGYLAISLGFALGIPRRTGKTGHRPE